MPRLEFQLRVSIPNSQQQLSILNLAGNFDVERTVRRIRSNCQEEFVPEPELLQRMALEEKAGTIFYHGSGCDRCKGRGYLGRVAVIEALLLAR